MATLFSLNRRTLLTGAAATAGVTLFAPSYIRKAYAERTLNVGYNPGAIEAATNSFARPFTEATGIPVQLVARRDNPATEIQVQSQSGSYQFDVTGAITGDVYWQVAEHCQPLDLSAKAIADLPDYSKEAGWVGYGTVAYMMAYQTEQFPDRKLVWEDLLDVTGAPGNRALRKRVNENVELAVRLLGVEPKDIYTFLSTDEGWNKVFGKLDQLKPVTEIWWDSDSQVLPLLANGTLSIAPEYNVDIAEVVADGGKISLNWDRGFFFSNGFVIPKGTPNADIAQKFIEFSLDPARMASFCAATGYGPTVPGSIELIAPEIAKGMPTDPQNLAQIAPVSAKFWSENVARASTRFNEWLLS
jgi:putative spermidine/putrescine transport system substrate-binding protein